MPSHVTCWNACRADIRYLGEDEARRIDEREAVPQGVSRPGRQGERLGSQVIEPLLAAVLAASREFGETGPE